MDGDTLVGGYRSVEGALHGEFEKLRDCSGPEVGQPFSPLATFFLIGAPGRREVGKFCWSAPRSGGIAAHRAFVARVSKSDGEVGNIFVGRGSRSVGEGWVAWVDSQFGGMGGVVEEGECL